MRGLENRTLLLAYGRTPHWETDNVETNRYVCIHIKRVSTVLFYKPRNIIFMRFLRAWELGLYVNRIQIICSRVTWGITYTLQYTIFVVEIVK